MAGNLLLAVLSFASLSTVAQPDTVISYDFQTQSTAIIDPVPIDTTVDFDFTAHSTGSLGNPVFLNTEPPTENLFSGSNFNEIEPAQSHFSVLDYPVRTAVKLFGWIDGTMEHVCSGMMVGENMVLTAAHCVLSSNSQDWLFDSLLVAPAYDNAEVPSILSTSVVEKCYIFQSFYDHTAWDDIALLQLDESIGQQTGWVGIAFSADTAYFSDRVFHKFSYPYENLFISDPIETNGDTMYYNYGQIDILSPLFLGVNSPEAIGYTGQSGSSLLYTDNLEYHTFGVFSLSLNYRHYQITRPAFYQLKNIVENVISSIDDNPMERPDCRLFPNPAGDQVTISLTGAIASPIAVELTDMRGRVLKSLQYHGTNQFEISLTDVLPGLYVLSIQIEGRDRFAEKLMVH